MEEIKVMSHKENIKQLKQELESKGLVKSVKSRCDELFEELNLNYIDTSFMSGVLSDILDLCKLEEKQNGNSKRRNRKSKR